MDEQGHLAAVLDRLGYRQDPECVATPERFLDVLREFAPGRPPPAIETFPSHGEDPVVLRGLPFHSLCAHHLLPFLGEADVAYRPRAPDQGGRIAGLGAIPRSLRHFARQPQLQERLGAQLADFLHGTLGGTVGIRLRARQMCMEMRGAESPGLVETICWRGPDDPALRALLT
jgi:GTP cyclohydrolase I